MKLLFGLDGGGFVIAAVVVVAWVVVVDGGMTIGKGAGAGCWDVDGPLVSWGAGRFGVFVLGFEFGIGLCCAEMLDVDGGGWVAGAIGGEIGAVWVVDASVVGAGVGADAGFPAALALRNSSSCRSES